MPWPFSNPFAFLRRSAEGEAELAKRLRGHVEVLAGLIGPRYLARPSSIDATLAYIERQFREIGDAVVREVYDAQSQPAVNLIVQRQGTREPRRTLIVGAHYDTVFTTPGADDNASAVAMLIETARLLAGRATRRTVRFVAFACEEPPYFHTGSMGSQHHAQACRLRNEDLIGMLCLEMVGYYTREPGSQRVPDAIPRLLRRLFPSRGDFLAAVGNPRSLPLLWSFHRGFRRTSPLRLFSVALPELIHEIRLSDNSSFWDQGYRALMLTDTSFLRNPHYHMPTDTPETLDYASLARATLGVAGGVMRLAGA